MDVKEALKIVIDDLDNEMVNTPSQELANVSNFLQARLDKLNEED